MRTQTIEIKVRTTRIPNSSIITPEKTTGIIVKIVTTNHRFPNIRPLYSSGVCSCKKVCAGISTPEKKVPTKNIATPDTIIFIGYGM